MTDYTELVKALRCCGKDLMPGERCKDSCPYGDIALCLPKLKLDAAAAIEDMAKHITEMHERVTVLQIARGKLEAEVKRLEPKRGEIVRCVDCKWNMSCGYISTRSFKEWKDWFCADGERKVQE